MSVKQKRGASYSFYGALILVLLVVGVLSRGPIKSTLIILRGESESAIVKCKQTGFTMTDYETEINYYFDYQKDSVDLAENERRKIADLCIDMYDCYGTSDEGINKYRLKKLKKYKYFTEGCLEEFEEEMKEEYGENEFEKIKKKFGKE